MKIKSWFISLFSRNGREGPLSPDEKSQVRGLTEQKCIETTKRSLGYDSQRLRIDARKLTRQCAKLNEDLGEMSLPERADETS